MKIVLLSDTHSYIDDAIKRHLKLADEIWHAGDIGSIELLDELEAIKPCRLVYGNIDDAKIRRACPREQIFEVDGQKVYMIHIGGYPPKYRHDLMEQFEKIKPDIFICGHSHILKVIYDKNKSCLHLNPGAAGTHGFHKVRTLLKFEINSGKLENMQIVELGKRG